MPLEITDRLNAKIFSRFRVCALGRCERRDMDVPESDQSAGAKVSTEHK